MPLVRVEVRNEYALGAPELYRDVNKEDPKEILDGVAVAGLVGVLRQLGDLAEFAAEVFHGLQEEVTIISSRSCKLMARVQRIEAALSPLEKAVLAQRSHLHFAYTGGSNWHTRIRCEENHFVYSDVPQFIMDSYEDSRSPPRLHLLDRFDTGGPGSCLKRYSDPTFFKRASVASGDASTEKILHKKNRKIKKRRSWPRSTVSRDASFSYPSGRMQFTELNVGGRTSSSQTMSTYDATTQRSDFGERSNLDHRNESDYIEGDFRPSYSVQTEEQESRESISSAVKRRDSDFLDYTFLEEKITNTYDDTHTNLSQEQAGCSSSSVTWDEKAEALEPTTQYGHAENLDSISPNLEVETLADNVVSFETVDEMDIQPFNQAVRTLQSGDFHHDDIESETDNFMDALNTIESEGETDIDCTKKQDVKNYSNLEEKGVDDGHNLDGQQSSNSVSDVLSNSSPINGNFGHNNLISGSPEPPYARNSSINGAAANDESNSVSVVDKALQSTQRPGESSNPGTSQRMDSHQNGNNDDTSVEFVSSAGSSNFTDVTSEMPIIDGTRSTPESQKHPETSKVTPVTFWTNGGLLGLQPSKPPDFSMLNGLSPNPACKKDEENSSSQHLSNSDKDPRKTDQIENFKNIEEGLGTSFRKTSWKISPADLDINVGKLGHSLHPNTATSTEDFARNPQEGSRSSSRMFELGNKLLSTASYRNPNAFEQKISPNVPYRTFSGRTRDETPKLSPSSSPPLEHMKISFRPVNVLESSKLKLKFPAGNTNNENGRDIFPSFQLVPEESIARHNEGSDSEDDTFYRSSPSLSNDCLSGSNSEQWESGGESPTSKDHDMYDSFQRISLEESVSNGRKSNGDLHDIHGLKFSSVENSREYSQSCRSFNIKSLDTLNNSFREEIGSYTDLKDYVGPRFAPSPAPPPLPPMQWRSMSLPLDGNENKVVAIPEGSNYDIKLSASTISQQPKPAPLNHVEISETTNLLKSKQLSSQKSNGRREINQGNGVDERVDFLHQIRTKAFNLRPTMTKSYALSSGPANVQVTAILEKANAIRQAVGSDDGEDDGNWSEA